MWFMGRLPETLFERFGVLQFGFLSGLVTFES